jgi:hypothetical protein
MNATVAWSYRLLDADEQRAFRRFGALPGVFPIDAAAAVLAGRTGALTVTDDALRVVAGLMDKSLLLRVASSSRTRPVYQMLETVRAYATLELTAAGERDDALEGLTRYCNREAALAAEELIGPRQVEWFHRLREDLDNYRAVLARLIEHGRAAEAADMASALMFFWLIRGHATEGLRWYEQILSLPSLPPIGEAKALLGAAATWHTHGEPARARTCLTRALALSRGAGDGAHVALTAWMFGHVEYGAGDVDAARDWFVQSLDEFRALGIPWGIGSALSGLGWVALATGDGVEAERFVAESTTALQSCGSWFLSLGLYIRIVLVLRRRKPDEVFALMRQSLTRVREFQDMFAVVYGLVPLAAAAAQKGDDVWVARILGARNAISERAGSMLVDPMMCDLCEKTERDARERLGPDRWAEAYAIGRRSSIDGLLKDIDRALA